MSVAGTERRRHLVTAVIGTVLMLFMGTVLLLGFRFATQMRTNIIALQTASTLQTYPEEISHQLNALRDRLEVRAYSGQALADLQGTVHHFDEELRQLSALSDVDSPQAMLNTSPAAPAAVHASRFASTAFSMKQKSREVSPSP